MDAIAQGLPDFRLEVYLGRWEFAARHHLTASDAETLTVGELLDLAEADAREAFERLPLSYTPTWGTPALLDAIADTYDTVAPEHVLSFAGAEEAMFWALAELVGPGEHAIVTVPNYQSMESVTLATGADVDGLVLRPEDGWRLELDPAMTLPQAADLSARAISLGVMSKAYGLPGLRIGWLACRDRALLERLERRKHYTSICNAGPSEHLAVLALRAGEAIRARNRGIIAENLPRFAETFARWPEHLAWEAPQGGCADRPAR